VQATINKQSKQFYYEPAAMLSNFRVYDQHALQLPKHTQIQRAHRQLGQNLYSMPQLKLKGKQLNRYKLTHRARS
jgi:hypothetical protein